MVSRETSNETPDNQQAPTQIVCVYDQSDQQWYDDLKTYLILWERARKITWLEMQAGADTAQTMEAYLQRADLILLLLSPTFFASHPCYNAMRLALHEQEQRPVPVVPIIARACDWKASACDGLKALPENALPLAQWTHPEQAYGDIRTGLTRLIPGLSGDGLSGRPQFFQARDLPKGYVPRPEVFHAIKQMVLNREGGQTTGITTALRGAGGFGKTTLALALCHDPEIQAAFPNGILWVELGEQPPRPLDVFNGVLQTLEPSLSGAITLEEARDRWRKALKERACLLVIDDVWQTETLEELLKGGPRCGRLVTTRNDQLLPEEAKRIWVDAMEPEEAIAVLCRGLPEEIQQVEYQPVLDLLATQLGYWPLLLTLARGMLAGQLRTGKTLVQAISIVEQAYQTRGVAAFHLGNGSERQRTADACLEVSLRHLEDFTPIHYHAIARYHELAVFPEDIDIPLTILQTYWQGTGGLENWETEDLCTRLYDLSLLLAYDLERGTIRLHDVIRSALVQRASSHLPVLHGRFLLTYQQVVGLKRWADLPSADRYLWQHLIWHFCQAGKWEELQTTLTDLSYLARKALYQGVSSLEGDLLQTTTPSIQIPEVIYSWCAALHNRVVRLSHLLRQTLTLSEMGGLLLSHLGWEPAFAAQRLSLELELARPLLLAWHPLPGGSSSALLRTFHGHTDSVEDCAVSPDGSFIVSASRDNTLKVWDATAGTERLSLTGHTGWVTGCAVSPDGSFIVSASADNTLKVWDATTGVKRLTLTGHTDSVEDCAVSPDGSFIVSASADNTLKVWDATTGTERLTLTGHTDSVLGCSVSPDGSFIASASINETLIWGVTTGVKRLRLSGHTDSVEDCAVSPDSSFIVSASMDNTLKVWDAITGVERLSLTGHTSWVTGCTVSPDSSFIVSASEDKTLKVWDAITGVERLSLTGHTGWVTGCAVGPDGSFIVSASTDHTLKMWDVAARAERISLVGHSDRVTDCAVSPDGSFIVSASADNTLKVWDGATGTERLSLASHTYPVSGCAISPDSRWIVSASGDNTLKVWDAIKGIERLTLIGHTNSVHGCAVSPDGRWIVSASEDKTLKVWDGATGVECLSLTGHTNWVAGCAISPDSRWIVSASGDNTLKVWDAIKGIERLTLTGHTNSVHGCAVSPDGRWIVSTSWDHTLKVWNAQTGQCTLTFPVDGILLSCAFHPDGEHLVACGVEGVYFLRLMI